MLNGLKTLLNGITTYSLLKERCCFFLSPGNNSNGTTYWMRISLIRAMQSQWVCHRREA